jgi:hypothetical protein
MRQSVSVTCADTRSDECRETKLVFLRRAESRKETDTNTTIWSGMMIP